MPPSRNNTVRFTDLSAMGTASLSDIIPIVDTSIPTQVNKKITITGLNQSLPLYADMSKIKPVSSNWDSAYSSFNANSAEYESAYTSVNSNSANWDSTYSTVQTSSAAWVGLTTYTTVQENSAGWESVESTVVSNSAGWTGGNSAFTTLNILSTGYWLLKSGDQITGALTTTKSLTTQFTNSEEFVSKRYADALAFQAQVSGNFVPALYYNKTESDDRFFNQGETNLLVQNISSFTGNNINIHSNTLILSSQNNASSSPLFRMPRFNAGLYFDAERCLIRGDHWGDGDAGFIQLQNNVIIGRSLTDAGLHINVTNPKVFVLGNNTESGIGFSPTTNYVNSDTYLMREQPYTLALRTGTNQHALRIYNTYTNSSNYERIGLSATKITYEIAGTGTNRGIEIERVKSINLPFYADITPIADGTNIFNGNGQIIFSEASFGVGSRTAAIGSFGSYRGITLASSSVFSFANNTAIAGGNFPNVDITLARAAAGILDQRGGTTQQVHRIYNTYTDVSNYERLSLSATRIAYEFAGTGVSRDLTIQSTGNLILSGAAISFNTATPFAFGTLSLSADRIRLPRTNATSSDPHISIAFNDNMYWLSDGSNYVRTGAGPSIIFGSYADQGGFATRINGVSNSLNFWLTRDSSICWNTGNPSAGFTETGDLFLFRDAPYVLAIRDRAAQTGTNALRIYNTFTDSSNYTRLSLSGSRIAWESNASVSPHWALINQSIIGATNSLNIESQNYVGISSDNFALLDAGGRRLWWNKGSNYIRLNGELALQWAPSTDAGATPDSGIYRESTGTLAQRYSTNPQNFRIYNTYTDANNYERLSLSATRIAYEYAGTGVSRDLTISTTGNLILSGAGIFLNTPTPFSFGTSQLSAYRVQLLKDPATGFLGYIDTPFDGTIMRLGGAWNVTTNNFAANNFGRGQINFPGVVNTPNSFALNNEIYLRSDSASSTDLICLSSNKATAGFYFYGKSSVTTPASIFVDSSDNLILRTGMGGGKSVRFYDLTDTDRYTFSIYQAYMPAVQIIAGINTSDSLRIIQRSGQTGSYFKALSSDGISTVFEVNSSNNVFVRNLVNLGTQTSSGPAIRGSGSTVQARTGDDSQYTYLQGKLQTDQAANAGTFTPDKYIILYDSTGTAYKVPVQAL